MKLPLSLALALGTAVLSSAHRIPFKKIKHTPTVHRRDFRPTDSQLSVNAEGADNTFDLDSVHDLIYIANITVAGVEYPVQLDTGSSDMWIKGASYPIPNTTPTDISYNLSYAIGWAQGNVAFAPVEFVGISVPSQAFIDVKQVNNPAIGYGAKGIAGLGFTRLSNVDLLLNSTKLSTGRSLLFNLFEVNPNEQNFIAFALQRESDGQSEVEGSFAIGELDPAYEAISGNEHIPTWPVNHPYRWNVLLDAVIVNETITVPTTKVSNAPSNKAVILMDSGSSYTYAPPAIVEAIYGGVPGAYMDNAIGYWRVPCGAEVNMALQIGGQVFPIHPLDINPRSLDPNTCIGSFVPTTFAPDNDYDWLVGDNFLRSVYSVYDFGDFDANGQMGNPYMKLLSIVNADDASFDFHKERGGVPRTNITFTGLDGVSVAPSFAISTDISESLELIGRFIPAMLAIVALNALIVIVCCIVWLVSFLKKRRANTPIARARTPRARMSPHPSALEQGNSSIHSGRPMFGEGTDPRFSTVSAMDPMPMNPRNTYVAGLPPPSPGTHTYEPVSMALTEDTFVPPMPAFYGKAQIGDRPKSVA